MRLRSRTRPLYWKTKTNSTTTTIATMTMMAIKTGTSSPGGPPILRRRSAGGGPSHEGHCLLVDPHVRLGEAFHRELARPGPPGRDERAAQRFVVEHPAQRVAQRGGVAGWERDRFAFGARDVAVALDVGGDDRGSRRQRLEQHEPERLPTARRCAEHRRAAQALRELVVGEHAEPLDVLELAPAQLVGLRAG